MKTNNIYVLIFMLIVALNISGCGTTTAQTQDNKATILNQTTPPTQVEDERNDLLAKDPSLPTVKFIDTGSCCD